MVERQKSIDFEKNTRCCGVQEDDSKQRHWEPNNEIGSIDGRLKVGFF